MLKNPRPGMIFQGNWDRVMVAVTHKEQNARYVNRYAAEIAYVDHHLSSAARRFQEHGEVATALRERPALRWSRKSASTARPAGSPPGWRWGGCQGSRSSDSASHSGVGQRWRWAGRSMT